MTPYGIRKTIYVPSQKVWDEVLLKAKSMGLSMSQYLLGGNHVPIATKGIDEELDSLGGFETQIQEEKGGEEINGECS